MIRSTLGVLAAGAGLSALVAAQTPPAAAPAPRESAPAKPADTGGRKTPPDADLRTLEPQAMWAKKEKPRKVNGAIFTVRASAEHKFAGDVIVLDWSLDYDGRRAPLVILGPTLDTGRTRGATKVNLYAVPAGRNAAWTVQLSGLTFNPAQRADPPPPPSPFDMWGITGGRSQDIPKELFLTVWPEKPATGTFRVPANRLREELAKRGADHAFDPKTPPRVFAEVLHEPDDRGEAHDLDAWTGKLRSDVVEVPPLKSW